MSLSLEEFSFFEGLPRSFLNQWSNCFLLSNFSKRQLLTFPADVIDPIYFIRRGRVKISYYSDEGKEFIVTILNPGDAYSEHSLATATAIEDCEVYFVSRQDFSTMLIGSPELSLRLIKLLGTILRVTNDVIIDLAFREASARIASILLREREQLSAGRLNTQYTFNFTHDELASLSGTSRQTVNQILRRWEDQGMVELYRGGLTVKNWGFLIDKMKLA